MHVDVFGCELWIFLIAVPTAHLADTCRASCGRVNSIGKAHTHTHKLTVKTV